jgi:hypothetical protein
MSRQLRPVALGILREQAESGSIRGIVSARISVRPMDPHGRCRLLVWAQAAYLLEGPGNLL